MTYSILARDARTGELGGAVQSHYFAVGRRCLTLRPGVGVVASQAFGDASHGPRLMAAMVAGAAPLEQALRGLLVDDPNAAQRQIAALDASGATAAVTGPGCLPASGHARGDGVVAAGNTLANEDIPKRMVEAFTTAAGSLADRLLAALETAEAHGGDLRGTMSAALRVVGPDPTTYVPDGTLVDLRVDHAADPHAELGRLLRIADGHGQLVRGVLSPGRLVGIGRPPVEEEDGETLDSELQYAQERLGADDLEATFWRGVVALRRGRVELGVAWLREAITHRPAFFRVLRGAIEVGRVTVPEAILAQLDPDGAR